MSRKLPAKEDEVIYAFLTCLFIAQAVYARFLFEGFRRKVYIDVMDFLIERRKKEDGIPDDEDFSKRSHLRLVKSK